VRKKGIYDFNDLLLSLDSGLKLHLHRNSNSHIKKREEKLQLQAKVESNLSHCGCLMWLIQLKVADICVVVWECDNDYFSKYFLFQNILK
jgi:hypothetical protein